MHIHHHIADDAQHIRFRGVHRGQGEMIVRMVTQIHKSAACGPEIIQGQVRALEQENDIPIKTQGVQHFPVQLLGALEPLSIHVQAIVQRGGQQAVFNGESGLFQHGPYHGDAGAAVRSHLTQFRQDLSHVKLMVINDHKRLVGQCRYIALSGPAVHRNQKFRLVVCSPHMFQRDVQLFNHQEQIVFRDLPPAAVYQPGGPPLTFQISQQRVAAGNSVQHGLFTNGRVGDLEHAEAQQRHLDAVFQCCVFHKHSPFHISNAPLTSFKSARMGSFWEHTASHFPQPLQADALPVPAGKLA